MDLLLLLILAVSPTLSAPVGDSEAIGFVKKPDEDRKPRWSFNYAPGQIHIGSVSGGDLKIGHDSSINIGESSSQLPSPGPTGPVDCQWSEYTDWSSCSVSCGDGTRQRERNIATPAKDGGKDCVGEKVETEPCNTGHCTGSTTSVTPTTSGSTIPATTTTSGSTTTATTTSSPTTTSATKKACTGPPPAISSGSWECASDLTSCELICDHGYAPALHNIECVNGQWGVPSSPICTLSLYLLAGGKNAKQNVELYHPTFGSPSCQSPPADLPEAWIEHTTFTHDSTVYLCCGDGHADTCISLNTQTASSWTTHKLSLPVGYGLSSVVIRDKVLFIGGRDDVTSTYTTLPLSSNPTLTQVPNLSYKGHGQCVAKLSPTRFIISGGLLESDYEVSQLLSNVILYDFETKIESQLAELFPPRHDHSCIIEHDAEGKMWLVVTGGRGEVDERIKTLSTTQRLDIDANTWEDLGDLKQARYGHAMINSKSKGLMVLGGYLKPEVEIGVEVLDNKEWKSTEPSLKTGRDCFGGAVEVSSNLFSCEIDQSGPNLDADHGE